MRPKLPDRERKDSTLQFRLNVDERKRLEQLSKETGLTFAGVFRLKVLGEVKPMPDNEGFRSAIAEQVAILNRSDISDAEKRKLIEQASVKRIHATRVRAEKATKARERKNVKRYKGKASA